MSTVWLACCAAEELPRIERFIGSRDEGAQVLRLSAIEDLARMFSAFNGGALGVAVCATGDVEGLEHAIRAIAVERRARDIVVVVRDADARCIQRLYGAGATTVIDADGVLSGHMDDSRMRETHARGASCAVAPSEGAPPASIDRTREATAGEEGRAGDALGTTCSEEVATDRRTDVASEAPGEDAQVSLKLGGAPIVSVVSGRGGCGKTTVAAGFAWHAAQFGLRAALVDGDMMFGNLARLFGIDVPADLGVLARGKPGTVRDEDVEGSAMRVAPGLTLWGPCAAPELAELVAERLEAFLGVLRREADVVVVDTSSAWGESTAAAVAVCDRCLVVGGPADATGASLRRAVDLVVKLGVSKTRMVCVSNRCVSRDLDDDFALRAEMASGLGSRLRVPDAGPEVSQMLELGGAGDVFGQRSAFSDALRSFTRDTLAEIGCPVAALPDSSSTPRTGASRRGFELPWRRAEGHGRS